jgi:hypothetical protein
VTSGTLPPHAGAPTGSGHGPARDGGAGPSGVLARRFPPVAELCVGSLVLVLTGGVDLGASLPGRPPLAPVEALVGAGSALTLAALGVLSRLRPFAWQAFFSALRWTLLAYAVIAGVLAFVFVDDGTSGATLGVLLWTLVVFAVDVPVTVAFTVARYDPASAGH